MIPCACGCGAHLTPQDERGRSRRFISGHNNRVPGARKLPKRFFRWWPAHEALTAERLREVLHYDADTGHFTWLVDASGNAPKGSRAGKPGRRLYGRIRIATILYGAHRLAWLWVHGVWPTGVIDHIDGDPSNNRIANLRDVTHQENIFNQRLRSNSASGLKGVSRDKDGIRWRAYIVKDGRQNWLGSFDTAEEAHAAYCRAAEKLHGEFARAA